MMKSYLDSSRYFYAEGYQERQDKGEEQKQLSKEFVVAG
jgi:phosphoribosylaminoimidazole-succinocarboxamide synthase